MVMDSARARTRRPTRSPTQRSRVPCSEGEPLDRARQSKQQAAGEEERGRLAQATGYLDSDRGHAGRDRRVAISQRGGCGECREYQDQDYLHFLTRCPCSRPEFVLLA